MPSDPHGVAEEIEEHLEVEEPLLAKRFEMACSAKELEEDFALDTEEEDVLSQRTTELASSFGSSDDLRLALARGQAEAEESTARAVEDTREELMVAKEAFVMAVMAETWHREVSESVLDRRGSHHQFAGGRQ